MNSRYGLVVEDDDDLMKIFSQALTSAGYRTEVCPSGTAALEKLANVIPDMIVLDLHLPGVSGVDVLRQIQADARFGKTRIIVTTADPLLADSLRDCIDLVLIKPVSFRQLQELAERFA
jgi:CheY-like chemotaxis protein